MRLAICLAALGFAEVALGATVTLDHPTQGSTATSQAVAVSVSLSQDFQAGRDGWVEIWVDGARAKTLAGTADTLALAPGNHQIQARLVALNHEPLRVPANSEQVTVTVPTVDPHGP
jgi:hypothetical protein